MAFSGEAIILLCFQMSIFILFCIFGTYNNFKDTQKTYNMFQDIHVMIFIGFGFLMTFLKKYGYSAVGFNFLLGAILIEWSILMQGFFKIKDSFNIKIGLDSLYRADCAVGSVLISMGAVLGRTSYMQLLIIGILEIVFYSANCYLNVEVLKISDVGGSILIHTFGAYYGIAVSYMLHKNTIKVPNEHLIGSSYISDLLAMIGTLFLWLYWPSFNAIDVNEPQQLRAIINTYLSLAGSCVITFVTSQLISENKKFQIVHIQNSTLAGGVAIGASANLMVQPFGAILVGMIAGLMSVFGYSLLMPTMENNFKIIDTCGVQFLHGIPGIFGGIVAIIMALYARENFYPVSELFEIYPAMKTRLQLNVTIQNWAFARTAEKQATFQAMGLVVTLGVAIFTGLISGYIIKRKAAYPLTEKEYYQDHIFWEVPLEENKKIFAPFIIRKNTKHFDLIV